MARQVIYTAVYTNGKPVRPFPGVYTLDDIDTVPGSIISTYEGDATEQELPSYAYPAIENIQITITDISGPGFLGGDFSLFYAKELAELTIVASVDKPDGTQLILPMKREDTGRVIYKFAQVTGGSVSFVFAFPSSGAWACTQDLINTTAQGDDVFLFAGVNAIVDL